MKRRIAIIGAGISGLTLAQELKDIAEITVYEKARGVGGRMSARYADSFVFDHGTQCFTARTKEFNDFLTPYTGNGIITQWSGEVINLEKGRPASKRKWYERHYVASPNMNSLCKKMAENLHLHIGTEIISVNKQQDGSWLLIGEESKKIGSYDLVICTAPPAQTMNLFEKYLPERNDINETNMHACFSLMIGFNKPWDQDWIAAKVHNNAIKWISVNSTKPGRNKANTCFVAHSHNTWANKHIEEDISLVQSKLIKIFEEVTEINCDNADYVSIHRWRYAIVCETKKSGPYFDVVQKLAITSDWTCTSRIEEVWLSAMCLALYIKMEF